MFKDLIDDIIPDNLSTVEKENAMKLVSNWLVLSDYLSTDDYSLKELGLLLAVEARTKNRPQIVQRLKMRIAAQANKIFKAELREKLNAGTDD